MKQIDEQFIRDYSSTGYLGWTNRQLELITKDSSKGWIERAVGTFIPEDDYNEFMAIGKERQRVLKLKGVKMVEYKGHNPYMEDDYVSNKKDSSLDAWEALTMEQRDGYEVYVMSTSDRPMLQPDEWVERC